MSELNEMQIRFCEKYLECLNATEAAIYAGYSKKTAKSQGSRLLTNADIANRLKQSRQELSQASGLTISWVINRFKEISDRCMQAVPVMIFDPVAKEVVQKRDGDGQGVWEFDSSGANKATEMIGKHLGAFEKDNNQGAAKVTIESTVFEIKRRKK